MKNMNRKTILLVILCILFKFNVDAQIDVGGLGTSTSTTNGVGGDVSDQVGASGTTGGSQGAQVPIDGSIAILIAAGVAALGFKLYKTHRELANVTI